MRGTKEGEKKKVNGLGLGHFEEKLFMMMYRKIGGEPWRSSNASRGGGYQ